jgi:hypothetical protein
MKRRQFLATGSLALAGCRSASREIDGGFTGIGFERGHRLRPASSGAPGTGQVPPGEGRPTGSPGATRRVHTLIAGGGVAGLAAARALRQRGIDDFVVLELEDSAGGNSRGGQVNGIACPLGAHYLPVPGDEAHEVQDLLEELGLRQRLAGRWQYDERHLCHSPQERLFFNGEWQEGLLPVQGVGAATLGAIPALRPTGAGAAAGGAVFDAGIPFAGQPPNTWRWMRSPSRPGWTAKAWPTHTCAGTSTMPAATTSAPALPPCRPGPASTISPAGTVFMRRATKRPSATAC